MLEHSRQSAHMSGDLVLSAGASQISSMQPLTLDSLLLVHPKFLYGNF